MFRYIMEKVSNKLQAIHELKLASMDTPQTHLLVSSFLAQAYSKKRKMKSQMGHKQFKGRAKNTKAYC